MVGVDAAIEERTWKYRPLWRGRAIITGPVCRHEEALPEITSWRYYLGMSANNSSERTHGAMKQRSRTAAAVCAGVRMLTAPLGETGC